MKIIEYLIEDRIEEYVVNLDYSIRNKEYYKITHINLEIKKYEKQLLDLLDESLLYWIIVEKYYKL